jgi:hypothetical protein
LRNSSGGSGIFQITNISQLVTALALMCQRVLNSLWSSNWMVSDNF